MLITISYSVNFLPIGAVIILICDFTDIFVKLLKASVDVVDMKFTVLFYFLLLASWIVVRIYYFSWWILRLMHEQIFNDKHYV